MTKCFTEKIPARHILCFMFFSGFTVVFLLRVNINLAIVAMVKSNVTQNSVNLTNFNSSIITNASLEIESNGTENALSEDVLEEELFEWDEFQQGSILGAFFYGYMISQIPGGRIAELFGTKLVFGTAVLVNGILALLVPFCANIHWIMLFLNRALQGLAQGVMYPALSSSITKWVPLSERSKFVAITVQGCSLGPVIALPLCGWILTNWGWPTVFYFSAVIAGFWYCAWLFLVYDTPQEHPRISKKEKIYLEENLQTDSSEEKLPFPLKDALRSGQFWVGVIAHIGSDYGFHTFYTFAPKYLNEALGFDIESSAILSSLPYLCQYITANIFGILADCLLIRCSVPLIVIRKVSVFFSHCMPGMIVIILTFCGFDVTLSVIVLTIAVSMLGALTTGFYQNPIDIAPNFAGSLTGIANTFGSLAGIICTQVAGAATQTYGNPKGWHITFYVTASVYFTTSIPYLLFAKGKELPWNSRKTPEPVELKLMENGKPNEKISQEDE